MPAAYSRDNPRYARMYAAKDMRRKGYFKVGERPHGKDRILIYRRRVWTGRVTHDYFAEIHPDGSIHELHTVRPGSTGW